MAKKFLGDNGIPYQEFDVAEDKAAREEMINKCHQLGVPCILIGDDDPIIGFNETLLKERLGL